MILVKNINQYNEDYIYFSEPIKNNIMSDGNFIRIIYSSPLFVLNGIFLSVNLTYTYVDKYYNKFKCCFDVIQHKETVETIRRIEHNVLKKTNIYGKIPQYKIYEQLKNGHIKIFSDNIDKNNTVTLLKIAGIWETETEYGLTYKFITPNSHPFHI